VIVLPQDDDGEFQKIPALFVKDVAIPGPRPAWLPQERPAPKNSTELQWLARHQVADGSWPREKCACVAVQAKAPEAADAETVQKLVQALCADDIEEREKAVEALVGMGERAVAGVKKAAEGAPDDETRGRCEAVLTRISRVGPAVSSTVLQRTSLSLLAFLAGGYSHLSKDTHDKICYGDVVRRGLQRLLQRQQADGSFDPEDPRGEGLAALALLEAYLLTGSNLFKDNALAAAKHVMKRITDDVVAIAMKGMVAKLAEVAGVGEACDETIASARDALTPGKDEVSLAGFALLARWTEKAVPEEKRKAILALRPEGLAPEALFVVVRAMREEGEEGKAWLAAARRHLATGTGAAPTTCEHGSIGAPDIDSRLVHTAWQAAIRADAAENLRYVWKAATGRK
jgi:hypothetical protein